jgi:hypothetical protein
VARCEPKHAAATICGTSATTKPVHRLLCPRCCASNCQHTCHQKGCVKPFACTPAPLQQNQRISVCASSGQHSASLVVISTATQRSTQLAYNCCSVRDSHAHRPASSKLQTKLNLVHERPGQIARQERVAQSAAARFIYAQPTHATSGAPGGCEKELRLTHAAQPMLTLALAMGRDGPRNGPAEATRTCGGTVTTISTHTHTHCPYTRAAATDQAHGLAVSRQALQRENARGHLPNHSRRFNA